MPPRRPDFVPRPLRDRWEAKVERTDRCWEWRGARDTQGYGKIRSADGKVLYAHRVAYELFVGPIPEGKQLDHLVCDNKGCVNPLHLMPVTQWENIKRAGGWTAQRARATHCIHGHEFTPENTYILPRTGHRSCRTCMRISDRRRSPRRLRCGLTIYGHRCPNPAVGRWIYIDGPIPLCADCHRSCEADGSIDPGCWEKFDA